MAISNLIYVPSWVINDILVLIMATVMILYIVKTEKNPVSILLEFFVFTALYAAVFENFATVVGFYQYGRSILMIGNIPLTVPIIEYLILYSALKLVDTMKVPFWSKPIIVGFIAILSDFSLDPVAVKMIPEGGDIGRWAWYLPEVPQIYNEPVHNFTGWMYIIGYAALFIMIGRSIHKKHNYNKKIGYIYPFVAHLIALLFVMSPLTQFLTILSPLMPQESNGEWYIFIFTMIVPILILLFIWRGKMVGHLSIKRDLPIFLTLLGFPVVNELFCLIGGYNQILWLVTLAGLSLFILVGLIHYLGSKTPSQINAEI